MAIARKATLRLAAKMIKNDAACLEQCISDWNHHLREEDREEAVDHCDCLIDRANKLRKRLTQEEDDNDDRDAA